MGFVNIENNVVLKEVEPGYITFAGRKYAFDLDAIKKFCLISSDQNGKETEVTEGYDADDNGALTLSSKILREVKSNGNPQNDMIIYDVVKLFIMRLLENESKEHEFECDIDFSTALAINTMLKWKLLIEIE